jgi:hypothetical protein
MNDIFSFRLEIAKYRVGMKTKISSTRFFVIVTVYKSHIKLLYLCLLISDPFSVKAFHKPSIEKFSSTAMSFFIDRKGGEADSVDKLFLVSIMCLMDGLVAAAVFW